MTYTSFVTVACLSDKRWFDLDAVRSPGSSFNRPEGAANGSKKRGPDTATHDRGLGDAERVLAHNPSGAPPLDWWDETDAPKWNLRSERTPGMTNTITMHLGDVRDVMATLEDGSIHGIITSPPFLALRSYLPADHVDKHREIGSEPTPAAFIDTMLGLTAEWRRLLAPWATLCVEIGDTYSGSNETGWHRSGNEAIERYRNLGAVAPVIRKDSGWPLAKSLTGIPTLYTWSLAYNRNLLTGGDSPAGQWRIRNLLTWTRPNPPVGALGDKCRPATSFVTVACTSAKRWFDLDGVRGETDRFDCGGKSSGRLGPDGGQPAHIAGSNPAGAPPLDWWDETDAPHWQPLHNMATAPYKGAHYATYPLALPSRLLLCTVPEWVCGECGEPRRRIVERDRLFNGATATSDALLFHPGRASNGGGEYMEGHPTFGTRTTTLGWTDCGHNNYQPGTVLDPFAGSGTTAIAAALHGRNAILIDLDERNVSLVGKRIAETLRILEVTDYGDTVTWTVEAPLPSQREQVDGQMSIFDVPESRPVIELVADL